MLKRHEDHVLARLDEVYANGTAYLSEGELRHWYELQRISKAPWRDLLNRWQSLLEEKRQSYSELQVATIPGGFVLIYTSELEELEQKAE